MEGLDYFQWLVQIYRKNIGNYFLLRDNISYDDLKFIDDKIREISLIKEVNEYSIGLLLKLGAVIIC